MLGTNLTEKNKLVFKDKTEYEQGDILVAGKLNGALEGFIRKVVSVEEDNGSYIVKTEPAFLTDVFEKAHIEKRIELTDEGVKEASYDLKKENAENVDGTVVNTVAKVNENYGRIETVDTEERSDESTEENGSESVSDQNENDDASESDQENGDTQDEVETEYMFGGAFEKEADNATISGEAGFSVWVEIIIDIDQGDIKCGMALHKKEGAKLTVSYLDGISKEIEKELFHRKLPNYQFVVAGIPIVLTNELGAEVHASAEIEGEFSTSLEWTEEQSLGFQYDSKKNKVEEVRDPKEQKDISDGIDWSTNSEITGKTSAGIALHLTTKLYGASGFDISAGIDGNAEGKVSLSNRDDQLYAGYLNLSINPEIEGTLVVQIPVISEELQEQELFSVELSPIWEKKWQSSSDPEGDLDYTDTGKKGRTYKTRFGEVNNVPAQEFQFDIPWGWDVASEEVGDGMDVIQEKVVLSNDRGVTVTYWSLPRALGGRSGVSMLKADITKADDSEFVPGYADGTDSDFSSLGKFIVAKVQIVGELDMETESEFHPADSTFYALVPESYIGDREFAGQAGFVDEFSFEYPTPYAFIAESPDGSFTKSEERSVVKILKSFKVAE